MTELERQFLAKLATEPNGRTSYSLLDYDKVEGHLSTLFERGYIKNRRHGLREGLQITDAGKAYIGGFQS